MIDAADRGLRGGSFWDGGSIGLAAAPSYATDAANSELNIGFRVASPAPPFPFGIPALSPIGLTLVAGGLLGFGAYHRGRA